MKTELNTEIIAVGTEILLGQIANTNAKWMSEQLARNGINTYYHSVVGDNLQRLSDVFKQAKQRSNTIIVTGGLGPTEDDLSREAFQEISHIPIEMDATSLQRIEAFFKKMNQTMTENNKRQARVFKDSTVFLNEQGMAPGNLVIYEGVRWIFLPGVPREMKQIFTDSVLPYLTSLNESQLIHSKVLKFIGLGESTLEEELRDLMEQQTNPTIAPLAMKESVTVRLTAKAKDIKEATGLIDGAKTAILNRIGDYFYGEDETTLAAALTGLLQQQNKTISSAESLTGGLFADNLVAYAGVSNVFKGSVVCYAPEVKRNVLNVPSTVIETDGTVSDTCAELLAKNVTHVMDTDIGISFTGVAGPHALEGKAPGTVYIGLYDKEQFLEVKKFYFPGNREQVRNRTMLKGYDMLIRYLKNI